MRQRKWMLIVALLLSWTIGAFSGVLLSNAPQGGVYVEEPGVWSIAEGSDGFLVQYSNDNETTPIQFPENCADEILSDGAFINCYVDRTKMLAVYNYLGKIPIFMITTDKGETWESSPASFCDGATISFTYSYFNFCDSQIGWCLLGNDGLHFGETHLFSTFDGGKSWYEVQMVGLPEDIAINSISFSNMNEGIICTDRRRSDGLAFIYKTMDGGRNWDELVLPLDYSSNSTFKGTGITFRGPYGVLQVEQYEYANPGMYQTTDLTLFSKDYGKNWFVVWEEEENK